MLPNKPQDLQLVDNTVVKLGNSETQLKAFQQLGHAEKAPLLKPSSITN